MHICFQGQNFVNYVRTGDVPYPLIRVPIEKLRHNDTCNIQCSGMHAI